MDKPSYRLLLVHFRFDSLSDANRPLLSDLRAVGESSLYSQISIDGLPTAGFPYGGNTRSPHSQPVAADFSTKKLLTMNSLFSVSI
jgi:hypothetical protein